MKQLKDIKLNIAQKLMVGFGVIFVFILLNAILTAGIHIYTQAIQSQEDDEYTPVKEHLEEISELITETKRLTVNWVYVDHQPDTPDKIKLKELIDTGYGAIYEQLLDKTEDWDQAFLDTLGMLNSKMEEYFSLQHIVMNNLDSFESYDDVFAMMEPEMIVQSDGDLMMVEEELNGLMASLINICDTRCQEIEDSISFFSNAQLIFVILFSLIVMALSIGVGFLLFNSIVNPLKKGVAFAKAIGQGDLTATVEVHQDDEIGQLAQALSDMVKNLRKIVVTIEQNANQLVTSGELLKNSSLKLSKGASEQAASAEEVSTAIEEMVANIDQNTENAVATEKITSSTVQNVTYSSQYSNEAAEAMNTISQKITIISDIAFQTNILALNAAVEAVRAGEHGRGFSVVASEVRKLAERSKQAANEIVTLVAKGMKVSQMAGEKANALVPDIEKTTVLIKEISAASIEQKTGAEQINLAMQNLNVITQENASSSDELTNSSVQLSSLATNLKAAVSFFKLDENTQNRAEINLDDIVNNASSVETTVAEPQVQIEDSEANDDDDDEKPQVVGSGAHKGGATIDLGNISSKEFDLDNYEKF